MTAQRASDAVDGGWTTRQDLEHRLARSRSLILGSLDGVGDERARAIVVPGAPSMLGVVRHAASVEAVWFHLAVTGEPPSGLGLPVQTAASWRARRSDDVASITRLARGVHEVADGNLAPLELTSIVDGKGQRTILSLWTHVLEELAWNTGQLDVLRAAALRDGGSRRTSGAAAGG